MTQEEIIRMAREAGIKESDVVVFGHFPFEFYQLERFAALVAAHEREKQVEQEPVAWMAKNGEVCRHGWRKFHAREEDVDRFCTPLYAAPVRTKDLTDDEIRFWIGRFPFLLNEESEKWVIGLARAVIAAYKEKNQ